MYMKIIKIEAPNLLDRRFHQEIQEIRTCTAEPNDGNDVIRELRGEIHYLCSASECVTELENRLGRRLFHEPKGIWVSPILFHGGSRDDFNIIFGFLEKNTVKFTSHVF